MDGIIGHTELSTDSRELTDEELNAREALNDEWDDRYGHSMKQVVTDNGTFANLKNAVFTALVIGSGVVIWAQQQQNATFEREIAILKLECRNMAQARQP